MTNHEDLEGYFPPEEEAVEALEEDPEPAPAPVTPAMEWPWPLPLSAKEVALEVPEAMKPVAEPRFNLVDEQWIPVVLRGGAFLTLSLREVFQRSSAIKSFVLDSPLQLLPLVRLLTSVLYASFGQPATKEDWGYFWKKGELPLAEVEAYLTEHHEDFWLFHPTRPFLQVADLRNASGGFNSLSRLIPDEGTKGSGSTEAEQYSGVGLGIRRPSPSLSLAEAARWLLCEHAYGLSGARAKVVGAPNSTDTKTYTKGAALGGRGTGILLGGSTLTETLLLQWMAEDFHEAFAAVKPPRPSPAAAPEWDASAPAWENTYTVSTLYSNEAKDASPDARQSPAFLPTLTWQARRVRLFAEGDRVVSFISSCGDHYAKANRYDQEPHFAWRDNPNEAKRLGLPQVLSPVYMPLGREVSAALETLVSAGEAASGKRRPKPFDWLDEVKQAEMVEETFVPQVDVVVVSYGSQDSIIQQVSHSSFTAPLKLLTVHGPFNAYRHQLALCFEKSEQAVQAYVHLRYALAKAEGKAPTEQAAIVALQGQFRTTAREVVEREFAAWLASYDPAGLQQPLASWRERLLEVFATLGFEAEASVPLKAWMGKPPKKGGDGKLSGGKANAVNAFRSYRFALQAL